jgi:hypothetical protein
VPAPRRATDNTEHTDFEQAVLPDDFLQRLAGIVGEPHLLLDDTDRLTYGTDALKRGHPADAVARRR